MIHGPPLQDMFALRRNVPQQYVADGAEPSEWYEIGPIELANKDNSPVD